MAKKTIEQRFPLPEDFEVIGVETLKNNMGKREYKQFMRWMNGQTMQLFDNGEGGIYGWDYISWIRMKRRGVKKPFIWD